MVGQTQSTSNRSETNTLKAINRVLKNRISCADEVALGQVCLMAAQELTGSAFGFMAN